MNKIIGENADATLDKLQSIADEIEGGRVHLDYSGRGMYGATCASIYCDSANECLEAAGAAGLRGARTDSMGMGAVVYWPSIKTKCDGDDEEEV